MQEWSVSPPESSPLHVFSNVKTTSFERHHQLGHLVFPILKHIVSSYNLNLSSSMSLSPLCHACNCNKSHKLYFTTSSILSSQHLKFFSLMCELLLLSLIMILNIMLSLLIISQSIFGFIYLSKNLKFLMDFFLFKALVEKCFDRKIITFYSC